MKPRQQRMLALGLVAIGLAVAATLTLRAFKDNMMFFIEISDVIAGEYPKERNFRIGGLVVDGSIQREEGSLDMSFLVTDTRCDLPVTYSGVVPDLFRDGQGVVAHGRMDAAARSWRTRSWPSMTRITWRPRWPSPCQSISRTSRKR